MYTSLNDAKNAQTVEVSPNEEEANESESTKASTSDAIRRIQEEYDMKLREINCSYQPKVEKAEMDKQVNDALANA